jgi:hypothetical protein
MMTADEQSLLRLMEEVLPAVSVWEQKKRKPAQIFSLPVVVALMLFQRLDEEGTQQAVVRRLVEGRLDRLLPDGKRVRERNISPASGGYAGACQSLPVATMEKVCDQLLDELGQRIEPEPELELPVLVLDGSGISLEHRPQLLDKYPRSRNQYGQGHWLACTTRGRASRYGQPGGRCTEKRRSANKRWPSRRSSARPPAA